MANVRCPMCSKMNPPDADVCAYCGARLKPVRPPSTTPASTPKQSEPDWMRGLRGAVSQPEEGASGGKPPEIASGKPSAGDAQGKPPSQPAAGKPSQATPPAENSDSGTPDWLSRIRERSQADAGPFQEPSQEASQETPDWLKGISEDAPAASSEEDFGLGSDWMNRLQNPLDTTSKPAAPSQPETPSPFGDFDLAGGNEQPDWMRNLSDEKPASEQGIDWAFESDTTPPASGVSGEGAEEDWMKNIASWTSEPPSGEGQALEWNAAPPASEQPSEPASSGVDDMSWLDSFKMDSNAPSAPITPESTQDQGRIPSGTGLTNFLSSLNEPEPTQPGEAEFGSDFQGWEPPAAEKPAAEAFPGWATEEPAAPAEPQAGAESDISSWLRSFESETPAAPAAQEPAAPAESEPSETGIPDWLSGGPAEPPRTPKAAPREETGGLPAWLSGNFAADEPPTGQAPAESQPEDGLPGWLTGMEQAPAESAPSEPVQQAPEAESVGLPAWLSGDFAQAQPPAETPMEESALSGEAAASLDEAAFAEPAEQGLSFEGLPDWLSGAQPTEEAGQPPASEQAGFEAPLSADELWGAGQPAVSEPVESLPAETQPASPDWVSGFEQVETPEETPAEQAEAPAQAFAFDSAGTPDWLRDFSEQPPANASVSPLLGDQQEAGTPTGAESASPFAVDLPDWLGEEASAQPAQAAEHAGEPVNENLAQADLPDWVMKMRPLESVMPGEPSPAETDQRVEKAGPLAGMRGVLPAEEMVARYRKPPIYSAKLRVTEKQRSQATLLDSILAQETQPLLVAPDRSQAPRVILQIVIALVLVAALLFPLLTNFELMSSNAPLIPNELQNMYNLEKSIQSDKPVLLAVDYEPGYSGEMRLAASAVIDQLMSKNAHIVVISTVPTGPALADTLLQETAQQFFDRNQKKYDLNTQVFNLGYLPGGTVSLIEFANLPSLAAPATADPQKSPWNNALNGIKTISDFSQVIVLTDTAETGRAWVEQVGPSLKNVPLLMVASAQAAPMLLPYVDSGQIKGMVTGMMGGAMYSWPTGQVNNPARRYYTAYQVGVLVGLVLIIVGVITSAGRAMIKRGPKDEA